MFVFRFLIVHFVLVSDTLSSAAGISSGLARSLGRLQKHAWLGVGVLMRGDAGVVVLFVGEALGGSVVSLYMNKSSTKIKTLHQH